MSKLPARSSLSDRLCFLLVTLHALIKQRPLKELLQKTYRLWKRSGNTGIWRRLWYIGHTTLSYSRWVKRFDSLDDSDRQAILEHISRFHYCPRISILMPTYNSSERWLRQAIESVRSQLYPDWELCIADDASPLPHVRAVLKEYQRLDNRIRVTFRESNGHISAASNSALELATGEFVALLDHDDELPAHALYMVAFALNNNPDLNLIYSDEDKINQRGHRFGPYFKPDWNPDLLTAQNMVSHLGVYRTTLIRSIGGFREGVEGSQDWDLALRVAERVSPASIYHIPHVLYHWRAISGSTAAGPEEKPYVAHASLRVMQDHLQRLGASAIAEPAFGSFIRVRYALPDPAPLVSLLFTGNHSMTEELALRTRYPNFEILSQNDNRQSGNFSSRQVTGGKSRAEWFNLAANAARGEVLCLLDSDCLPQSLDWLEELVRHAARNEIGVAAPLIHDTDGNIQGAQTVLCDDPVTEKIAWSYYGGFAEGEKGQGGRAALQQNLSILPPGCFVVRAEIFRAVGGLDAEAFSNALYGFDLCLRLLEAGFHNLWTPYAQMTMQSDLPDPTLEETRMFRHRWKTYLDHDPAHNPNLACSVEWPFPAFPPRIGKPWQKL